MDEKTFTDEQVMRACNLHIDNLRRLITWGAVKPIQAGGGRGRVRLWSFPQAMRVAVTAEIFDAGFSLQMAHTLTYCLPLDDLLKFYDPDFLRKKLDLNDPRNARLKSMLGTAGGIYLPEPSSAGNIVVVDRMLVYADVLGDTYRLYGYLNRGNRYQPLWNWRRFYSEPVAEQPRKRDQRITRPTPKSLLLDVDPGNRARLLYRLRSQKFSAYQLDDPAAYFSKMIRNYLRVNLALGLTLAFRKLLGLSTFYPAARDRSNE